MKDKKFYIEKLNMVKHPEGGYFVSTYESEIEYNNRPMATSIYFLLPYNDSSFFHQLKSDELWYFHGGDPLSVYIIDENGEMKVEKLGLDIEKGEKMQVLVSKDQIFGSMCDVEGGYSIVGCVVAPGFIYEEFKLFSKEEMLDMYPNYSEVIEEFARRKTLGE